MPVPVVRPDHEVIAEEQEYLFVSSASDLADTSWALAECRNAEPDLFFPISDRDVVTRAKALAYCRRCPIQSNCVDVALRDRSILGIWGGTDERDREVMRGRARHPGSRHSTGRIPFPVVTSLPTTPSELPLAGQVRVS